MYGRWELSSWRLLAPAQTGNFSKHGLRADLIPEIYDGAHLGQALCEAKPAGKVLILRAQWGTKALTDALDGGTISCDDIRCYETRYTAPNTEEVRNCWFRDYRYLYQRLNCHRICLRIGRKYGLFRHYRRLHRPADRSRGAQI